MKYMGDEQMSLWYRRIIDFCQVLDFACPYDERVDTEELEKIKHYQDLAQDLRKIWNMKVKVIPLVIGVLGTTTIKLRYWLKEIGIETQVIELQKQSSYTLLESSKRFLKFKEI